MQLLLIDRIVGVGRPGHSRDNRKKERRWSTGRAITRLRTRSAAVRHWRDLSLSAYERDLVMNEKVQFRSLDPNRAFEDSFFLPRVHRTT